MRAFSTSALAVLLSGVTAACATPARFQGDKPVDIAGRDSRLRVTYEQDGKRIEVGDMLTQLESFEEARDDARAAKRWMRGGTVVGLSGVAMAWFGLDQLGAVAITSSSGENEALGWALSGAGVALIAGGIVARERGESHARRASEAHNRRLAQRTTSIAPWLVPIPDGSGQERVAMGVDVRF